MRDTCTHHFEPKKIDRVDRGGQGRSEKGAIRGNLGVILGEVCMANFSRNSASDWMKIFKAPLQALSDQEDLPIDEGLLLLLILLNNDNNTILR